MTEVIPAIIPDNLQLLRSEMEMVKDLVPRVQVDIMDGNYAPEASWPYNGSPDGGVWEQVTDGGRGFPYWKQLQFEIDLMIASPEYELDDWIATGASGIIIHASSTDNLADCIDQLTENGVGVGLALKPSDDTSLVADYRDQLDFVQLMGNDKIGYHGVGLDQRVYNELEQLRASFPDLPLAVDIGVSQETAPDLVKSGATKLVSGSAIFESEDIAATINGFRSLG